MDNVSLFPCRFSMWLPWTPSKDGGLKVVRCPTLWLASSGASIAGAKNNFNLESYLLIHACGNFGFLI